MQGPWKNYLNGYLYYAVPEKFALSVDPAVGRVGLDSRKEDDV